MSTDAQVLARALLEEWERDCGNDLINPFWLRMVADGFDMEDDAAEDAVTTRNVLRRVAKRLSPDDTSEGDPY